MPPEIESPYVEAARRRLSALMEEAAGNRSQQRRSELNERIELVKELLRVAERQDGATAEDEPVNVVRSLC